MIIAPWAMVEWLTIGRIMVFIFDRPYSPYGIIPCKLYLKLIFEPEFMKDPKTLPMNE
jgi:hypothetical protein